MSGLSIMAYLAENATTSSTFKAEKMPKTALAKPMLLDYARPSFLGSLERDAFSLWDGTRRAAATDKANILWQLKFA